MVERHLRVKRALAKTVPDLAVLLAGRAPHFVYGGRRLRGLPILTYHDVEPDAFEADLRLLRSGGYRTVGTAAIEAAARGHWRPDGRSVVLTFDDGLRSLTETAAPLLAAYGQQAIAFVVSGLVPPRATQTMTGWSELRAAVRAGTLEVGPHSLWHHHVPAGPAVVGFVTPRTRTDFVADIPVPRVDGGAPAPLGLPILAGRPRYTAERAFLPDPEPLARVVELVAAEGPEFFTRRDWKRRLRGETTITGRRESAEEADAAVVEDVRRAVEILERECPNPASRHLCYPWYEGDDRTDRLAARAGITAVYSGVTATDRPADPDRPLRLRRLPPDFLHRLPGPGRASLAALLAGRARTLARRHLR
jgi:peptidoglycan/xylan/chitin deacetylase (PgdA/CDA1 family)